MKKAKKLTIPKPSTVLLTFLIPLIGVLAFVLGEQYSLSNLPTGTQLEASRQTIIQQYLPASSINCTDSSDTTSPTDRVYVFFEYLRINKFDNRAVIRGCNNIDHLLMKASNGQWIQTGVNLNLDKQANPAWQTACLIDDITIADTAVRPEDKSIDDQNLTECRYIIQNNTVSSSNQLIKVNN